MVKARKNRTLGSETEFYTCFSKIGLTPLEIPCKITIWQKKVKFLTGLTVVCRGIILARLTRSTKRRFIVGAENGQEQDCR